MLLLVTGATGKVGTNLITHILAEPRWSNVRIRALCHKRLFPPTDRVEVAKGDMSNRESVERAMAGVTHVVHLATCKETPEIVMDVTVKGMFWLLESFRQSKTAQQFILIGGDASIGHFFYRHDGPITEKTPHQAYPGCYALSKVLEEVLLTQSVIQYGINGCCLRAPWIMEKDDFRYSLSFGDDVFGGTRLENYGFIRRCREMSGRRNHSAASRCRWPSSQTKLCSCRRSGDSHISRSR